nr:apocytochrome b [Namystynia karyoxenos]
MLFCNDLLLGFYGMLVSYATHSNLTIMFNWGVLAGVMFGVQICTGIILAWSFVASDDISFVVVDYFLRDGVILWCVRVLHSLGASGVFLFLYAHFMRSLFFGVSARVHCGVWCCGVLLWLLMMGTAFMGYVLPWGLMSYWALTVITNLLSVVPVVGIDVLFYTWGGYYITTVTVQRFYALHYLLPLVLVVVVLGHILLLHSYGSGSAGGVLGSSVDCDHFGVFLYKDGCVLFVAILAIMAAVLVFTDTLHHADNFLSVNRFVTPRHIVPEWYFLSWYSILRACSIKLLGVLLLVFGVVQFLFMSGVVHGGKCSSSSGDIGECSAVFVMLVVLGLLGGCMPVFPYVDLSGVLAMWYFWAHLYF